MPGYKYNNESCWLWFNHWFKLHKTLCQNCYEKIIKQYYKLCNIYASNVETYDN